MGTDTRMRMEPVPKLRRQVRDSGLFSRQAGPIVLARAPGRLDVMGGVADYSGSLVCEMPLAIAAGAAVQRRDDGQIVCRSAQESGDVAVPASLLAAKDPLTVRRALEGPGTAWARYMVGCAWWLAQRGATANGLSILVDSDVPLGGGVSSSAAVEVATMTALAGLLGVTLPPLELAAACQTVENRVVGAPCGVMDQVTSAMGVAGMLLPILCQPGDDGLPAQVLHELAVPPGYAFIGIHSGVRHEVSGDPYTDTRVAAFMGQKILGALEQPDPTCGHLARLNASQYESRFRGQLPEMMTGRAFLDQYVATNDPVTTVRSEKNYNVRAATDHGIFEMMRVGAFVTELRLAVEGRGGDLKLAGELMFASHRSYSECAHFGHAMTDALVEAVRAESAAGLLGAKITGGGCGGTVAVLMEDTPEARAAISTIRDRYTAQTGRPTMLFEGSGPGAAAWGHATLGPEDLS